SLRENLGGYTEAKTRFLTSRLGFYYDYLDVLLQRRRPAEAFAVAQQTKARALLDLLHDGRVELAGSLTPEERAQEEELRRRADHLNRALFEEVAETDAAAERRLIAVRAELRAVESELQTFTDTLYARHPDLVHKRV